MLIFSLLYRLLLYVYIIYLPLNNYFSLIILLIDFREKERISILFFYLFMHSLVDSCMCSDWESNPALSGLLGKH